MLLLVGRKNILALGGVFLVFFLFVLSKKYIFKDEKIVLREDFWRQVAEDRQLEVEMRKITSIARWDQDSMLTVVGPSESCLQRSSLSVLVAVISAAENFETRNSVRETFGGVIKENPSSKLVFILGRSEKPEERLAIYDESKRHQDLVIGNFIDDYYNLTVKVVFLLNWVKLNCYNANYVMKMDDDMILNVDKLWRYVSNDELQDGLTGEIARNLSTIRYVGSKLCLSDWEYPFSVYPDFLSGPGTLFGRDAIEPLLSACMRLPFFEFEDIFVTGFCALESEVPVYGEDEFVDYTMTYDDQRYMVFFVERPDGHIQGWQEYLDKKESDRR